MAYQNAPDDEYADEYDDDGYDDDGYDDEGAYALDDDYDAPRAARRSAKRGEIVPQQGSAARRAIDWGTTGGIVTIILLTLLYTISPVDAIPDVIPIAGQADDLVAITTGTATAGFLAFMRVVLRAMLASRIGRKGCVILAAVMGIMTVLAFIGLAALINAII